MPGKSFRGVAAPLDERETQVRTSLQQDLRVLAEVIGERNVSHRYKQLVDAARFIEQSLEEAGYSTRRTEFPVDGKRVWNIDVECSGRLRPEEICVVGAHYDTVPGVRVLMTTDPLLWRISRLARKFAHSGPDRTDSFRLLRERGNAVLHDRRDGESAVCPGMQIKRRECRWNDFVGDDRMLYAGTEDSTLSRCHG